MRFHLLSLVIVLCAMPLISPAGEKADNPLKKAKIGDYVVYKGTSSADGKDTEVLMKSTVIAKDEKALTTQTAFIIEGKTVNAGKPTKTDLNKPFDPVAFHTADLKGIGKWEKTGEGNEKVKIGEKTYDCNWISVKGAGEAGGAKIEVKIKVWTDNSAPLSGMVKMETETKIAQGNVRIRAEITESGSAK